MVFLKIDLQGHNKRHCFLSVFFDSYLDFMLKAMNILVPRHVTKFLFVIIYQPIETRYLNFHCFHGPFFRKSRKQVGCSERGAGLGLE